MLSRSFAQNSYFTRDFQKRARKVDFWQTGMPWDIALQFASSVLAASVACALCQRGWSIENNPGECWIVNGQTRINPFDIVSQIRSGKLNAQDWSRMLDRYGLDPSMPLRPSK